MTPLCAGVDIIEITRIRGTIDRWGERFLHRVYTDEEIRLCRNRSGSLATRFAAKEAVMKALGTGVRGVGWKEIEILSEPSGKPTVTLHGKAREKASELGLDKLAISLSDSRENAIAFVVGETR
ncbi:holo-ACP synthase [Chloroflexota bacterium]